jgi:hypothetical protein|tara:strand:- start:102 stop:332 length:231 start_codon:yes stop_codon:yes gene_type:complete
MKHTLHKGGLDMISKIDTKSLIIGFLMCAVAFLLMGAVNQIPSLGATELTGSIRVELSNPRSYGLERLPLEVYIVE